MLFSNENVQQKTGGHNDAETHSSIRTSTTNKRIRGQTASKRFQNHGIWDKEDDKKNQNVNRIAKPKMWGKK